MKRLEYLNANQKQLRHFTPNDEGAKAVCLTNLDN